jgi:hypothetical protein
MPVPPLPLELVALILDELALSSGEDDQSKRSNGRNVALVSKAWCTLGSAVVWSRIVLNSSEQVRSLVEHLEEHPNLPRFVKEIRLVGPDIGGALPDELDTSTFESASNNALLLRVWKLCRNLKTLKVLLPSWITGEACSQQLEHLKHLRHLDFRPRASLEAVQNTSSLLSSFASLTSLHFLNCNFPTVSTIPLPHTPHLLPIRNLRCINALVADCRAERLSMQTHLLNLVQNDTLESYTGIVYPSDTSFLDRLFTFPNLRTILLIVEESDDALPLLQHLFSLTSTHVLRKLAISGERSSEHANDPLKSVELRLNGTSSLKNFLFEHPPYVAQLELEGFYFRGDVEFPSAPADREGRVVFMSLEVLDEGEEQPRQRHYTVEQTAGTFRWCQA